MPPSKAKGKDSSTADPLKQKTLLGFFGKASSSSAAPKPFVPLKPAEQTAPASTSKPAEPSSSSKTPARPDTNTSIQEKKQEIPSSSPSSGDAGTSTSVDGGSGATPPSSVVDVDMMAIDDDDEEIQVVSKPARKRKLLIDDSDDEDEEANTSVKSLSTQLAKFKKPSDPSSSAVKSVASERSYQARSKKARTGSPMSMSSEVGTSDSEANSISNLVMDIDFDDNWVMSDEEDEEAPRKSKAQPKKKKKAAPTGESSTANGNSGSNSFLTSAEQRAQNQKKDKRAAEECYSFLKDIRDKDGNKPDSPDYDKRTLFVPKSAWKSFTPFEEQFWRIKQDYLDTVLFFQKGKFYELYENDADIGHSEFDLKLTDRVKMKMVGVPEGTFDFWAAKFLAKGYKVGRVDQVETSLGAEMRVAAGGSVKKGSGGKEIVRRELGKVLTNGTLVDGDMIHDEQAGHLVSVREEDSENSNTFGICVLDASTGEFNLSTFTDDACRTKLETVFRQLRPKEVVYTKGNLSVTTTRLLKTLLPTSCLWTALRKTEGLDYDETIAELHTLYPDEEEVEGTGIPSAIKSMLECRSAMESLGSMIWYLKQLNLDKDMLGMKNFNIYDPMRKGLGLVLDGQTLAHIEVLLNSEGTEEGSLLKLLGRCVTPFGKRLFRIWLCMPLRDVKAINDRLDAVDDLINHPSFEADFTTLAKGLPDLERIVARIHGGSCKVKDFLRVLSAFKQLSNGFSEFSATAESFKSRSILGLLRSAPDLSPYIKNIKDQFEKADADAIELVPRDGKDETYDEVMSEINDIESKLEEGLEKLKKKYGKSLEFWHSAVGSKDIYLVQVPTSTKGIPGNWNKSGSTKANARYMVPEFHNLIRSLKEARERRTAATKEFTRRLYAEFDADRSTWLNAIKVMAELDCLFSLAKASSALGEPSCRPVFEESDEAFVDFVDLRHPALCLRDDFIPNNVKLGRDVGKIVLLTGPNMGGKSTLMRMTAAGVIMAQMGMHVPAKHARLSPVDSVLTRMGAYDNMFSNASTFKVELDECCKILREATPKSLVILDELGRGTSTFDGMAIAGAVLHELATHTLALSCFATHYSTLTGDYSYHPNIRNMHMKTVVDDEKRELVFLYKLVEGVAESSFGTHVANLAGVPLSVVERAEVVSKDFAALFQKKLAARRTSSLPLVAQADFAYMMKAVNGDGLVNAGKMRQSLEIIRKAVGRYITE